MKILNGAHSVNGYSQISHPLISSILVSHVPLDYTFMTNS